MDQELSQTSSATSTEAKPRMTLDKHLALEAKVKELEDSLKGCGQEAGSVSREEFDNLKACLIKVATNNGSGNILPEFGYSMWQPKREDMQKYAS